MYKYFKIVSVLLWLNFLVGFVFYIIFMTVYFKSKEVTIVNNLLVIGGLITLIILGPALPFLFYEMSEMRERQAEDIGVINYNFTDVLKRLKALEKAQKAKE